MKTKNLSKTALMLLGCLSMSVTACASTESKSSRSIELGHDEIVKKMSVLDTTKHEPFKIENKALKVVATGEGIGWYSDSKGPLLFEEVEGNFLIETEVEIKRKDGKPGLPEANFTSAGLLVRDPSSTYEKESWIMYNIGFQNSFFGREIKATRHTNGSPTGNPSYNDGLRSLSTLYLLPAKQVTVTKLRIARVGNEIRCYYKANGKWHEEKPIKGLEKFGNGLKFPVSQFNDKQFRPNKLDLPFTVQVGLIANPGMKGTDPTIIFRDGYALFSYYKRSEINSFKEATKL